jgi:hypothetical protein
MGTAEGVLTEYESRFGNGAGLTRHLEALRTQHRNIQTIDSELEWLLSSESPDHRQVVEYGRKAERIAADYHKTFKEFQRAETRQGLVEELDLLVETPLLLNQVVVKYQHLARVPITPLKPEDLIRSRDERSRTIIKLVRDQLASRLESEGLRDILTSDSWEEAVEKAAGHALRKVEEFIDGETERIWRSISSRNGRPPSIPTGSAAGTGAVGGPASIVSSFLSTALKSPKDNSL